MAETREAVACYLWVHGEERLAAWAGQGGQGNYNVHVRWRKFWWLARMADVVDAATCRWLAS